VSISRLLTCLLLPAVLAGLAACAPAAPGPFAVPARPFVTNVTPAQAADIIRQNSPNPAFIILDVRTPAEFSAGHLEKAILIDVSSPGFESLVGKLSRDAVYLVYCRTGNRSLTALEIMDRLGFKYIYHLEAGISAWVAAGYPTFK
jgi:rhodanese-related sulfurtransferase